MSSLDQVSIEVPVTELAHTLADQKRRLYDIARALNSGETVPPTTVRTFLSWFWGTQRRGRWIVSHIRQELERAGLVTVPDFESTYLDAEIKFSLPPEPQAIDTKDVVTVSGSIQVITSTEIKIPSFTFADPTYRISKLAAANKAPTSVSPDATLTETVTIMMANDFLSCQ